MTLYANANISYGKENGERDEWAPGETVKTTDMPKDVLQQLVSRGQVVNYDPTKPAASDEDILADEDEKEELRMRIAQLEKQLDEANQPPTQQSPSSSKASS
jgi:hypothetical protein